MADDVGDAVDVARSKRKSDAKSSKKDKKKKKKSKKKSHHSTVSQSLPILFNPIPFNPIQFTSTVILYWLASISTEIEKLWSGNDQLCSFQLLLFIYSLNYFGFSIWLFDLP